MPVISQKVYFFVCLQFGKILFLSNFRRIISLLCKNSLTCRQWRHCSSCILGGIYKTAEMEQLLLCDFNSLRFEENIFVAFKIPVISYLYQSHYI